jgi:hypothetical protein
MPLEQFHTDTYKLLIQDHLYHTITFLLEHGIEFSIAVEIRHTDFSPELPRDIMSTFESVALFVMAGYTFESAHLDESSFYFEAGFGAEGFGSQVSMPLLAIKQVFVDEYPIAINISEPLREKAKQTIPNRSMEALLSNPENKKLLIKSKK